MILILTFLLIDDTISLERLPDVTASHASAQGRLDCGYLSLMAFPSELDLPTYFCSAFTLYFAAIITFIRAISYESSWSPITPCKAHVVVLWKSHTSALRAKSRDINLYLTNLVRLYTFFLF